VVKPGSGAALLFAAGIRDHKFDPVPPRHRRSTAHKVVLRGARLFMGLVQAVGILAGDYPSNRYYPNNPHRR
jgi:hypothetical protein